MATDKLIAEVIAETLAAHGSDVVFGFPGEGTIELIRAFAMHDVRFVLARSETGAAFMAAAHAEIERRPGVVVTTLGPGVTNVVTGAAYAALDRVPLLVVTDRFTDAQAASSGRQRLDHGALLGPVVKATERITAGHVRSQFERALSIAGTPPRGAVHLDLPRDVSAGADPAAGAEVASAPVAASAGAGFDETALQAVRDLLEGAERPLVMVGLEANDSVRQTDLLKLTRALDGPVLTTYKAKGLYPESEPRWAGLFSGSSAERPVLAEADVVLLVGVDSVESQPVPWSYGARVAALCEQRAGASYFRPSVVVEGDVGAAVGQLAQALAPRVSRWPAALADGFGASVVDGLRLEPPNGGLAAWQVVETVQRVVRARSEPLTVTVDAGSHRLAVAWSWRSDTPGRFLTTNGLGTMGYAVPAAIGSAVARPAETVLAFTGDGGFTLHGYELETAVRIGAKVVVVVFNDASLSQIRIKQARRSYPRSGVDFAPVRYDHIARAMGARGLRVDDAEGLADAVDDALSGPQSCVIDVVLTGGEYGEMLDALRGRKT